MENVSFDNPFFDEISKLPVTFATPVLFGDSPNISFDVSLNNGTATLLRLGDRFLAVTCHHLLEEFRRFGSAQEAFFQLGDARIVPEQYLVSENRDLDLAVLDLSTLVDKTPPLTEANFFCPRNWPPETVSTDDVICLAGFPGIWRNQLDLGHLRFYSYSSGATEVVSVKEHQIVSTVQIQDCVSQINHGLVWGSLGGLSGGPVFVWRKTPILVVELVGIVYEYQENLDLMLIRSTQVIREDGTLDA